MHAVAGCGVQSREPAVAVVDSAGVRIVQTTSPLCSSGSPWTISDASDLAIGKIEGERHELFSGVTGLVRLGDGRIVIADIGPRPVTDTDIERYVESRQRLRSPRRRRTEARLLHRIPYPETFPAFADLVLDTEGYLWAAEYRRAGDESTRTLDDMGALRGSNDEVRR